MLTWTAIRALPWRWIGLGALVLGPLAIQHVRYEGLPLFGGGIIERIETERDAAKRGEQKAKTALASLTKKYQTELAEAEVQRAQAAADYTDAARRADRAKADLDDMRSRARNYATRMRIKVRQGELTDATADSPAPDRNGPGEATEFIAVTRNDFDILVENSLRLEGVWRWGQDLIDRQRAVPMPDPELSRSR